jgi:hypothetical protein
MTRIFPAVLPTPAPAQGARLPAARTVEVPALSSRGEAWAVARVAGLILCLAAGYIASSTSLQPGTTPLATTRPPYQRLFRDLPADRQRMYREMQEGVLEAENTRLSAARWPSIAELETAGVPPFSDPPRARTTLARWALHRDGLAVNYLGLPTRPGQPAYLVMILEPDPATPHGAVPVDEEHQRLPDGTILHVSLWMRAEPPADPARVIALPPAEGWLQMITGTVPPPSTVNPLPGRP